MSAPGERTSRAIPACPTGYTTGMPVVRDAQRRWTRLAACSLLAVLPATGCDDLAALRPVLDGAAPDASLSDGGAGLCAQTPVTCAAASLFCDSFELASDAKFPGWGVQLGNYSGPPANPATHALASTAPVCHGERSLAVQTVGTEQFAILSRQAAMPNPVYVRYYYLRPTSSDPGAVQMLQLSSSVGGRLGQLSLNPDSAVWEDTAFHRFNFPATRDRWTCVELMVKRDATQGALSLRIDDSAAGSFSGIDTRIGNGALDQISIGATVGSGVSGTVQIFYDDVVVSAAPIGC